jgi:hypothetical protein
MIRKIKNVFWYILIKLKIGGVVQLFLASGLKEDGWFESFNIKESIDKDGNPIPWCTYSFIKFIEPRLKKHFKVFEYGSGNSTLWYAKRVNEITSVENDFDWYKNVSSSMPSNAQVIYCELKYDGDYCRQVLKQNKKYNIIIIDGRDRINCTKLCIESLTEDGVIVFDNSNLTQYTEAIEFLARIKFKRLDFWSLSPVTSHNNCTSIFYKSNNCLMI